MPSRGLEAPPDLRPFLDAVPNSETIRCRLNGSEMRKTRQNSQHSEKSDPRGVVGVIGGTP